MLKIGEIENWEKFEKFKPLTKRKNENAKNWGKIVIAKNWKEKIVLCNFQKVLP